jgi:hypothetical protein
MATARMKLLRNRREAQVRQMRRAPPRPPGGHRTDQSKHSGANNFRFIFSVRRGDLGRCCTAIWMTLQLVELSYDMSRGCWYSRGFGAAV